MLSKMLRGSVNNTTNPPLPTDPNFNQVSLLLHGDGTNGAQNNTFIDSSTNNFTITRNGNTTQGTNTPFSQAAGYWSNYFNGTTDIISAPSNAAFNFGTGDFTVECWCYLTSLAATTRLFAQAGTAGASNTSIVMSVQSDGRTIAYVSDGTNFLSADSGGAGTITLNAWTHVVMVRDGSTLRLYVNGVQKGTGSLTGVTVPSSTSPFVVGRSGDSASEYTQGYISNMRVVKGTCVYPSGTTFTPSTTPLTAISGTQLLTCQSNRFVDNSSNNFTLTVTGTPSVQPFSPFAPTSAYSTSVNGGSMYFDGTGDYLTAPNISIGTNDFTIEFWSNTTNSSANQGTYDFRQNYITNTGFIIGWVSTIGFFVYNNIAGVILQSGSGTGGINAWYHIAVTRSSSTIRLFVNGVLATSAANTVNYSSTSNIYIGNDISTTSNPFFGYISNVRVNNTTALYTTTFTPPTAPLTAITNTSLLLSGTNAGIYDNAIKNDLETVGDAQVSTSVTKFGTGSMKFDGTGDWLTSPDTPNLQLGTGNFTIEGWVYLNAVGSARGFVSKGTSTTGWSVSANSSNQVVFSYASSTITSTGTLSVSTWYFITVVREGTGTNQTKIYINGTNDGTGTVATDFNQTSIMYVGADRVAGSALNGYIDDLRITKGVARYTATFTPPTSAFPNQ